jgi:uncharacterized protein YbaP (TraB family)
VGRFKRSFRGWLALLGLLGGVTAHAEAPVWAIKGAHNTVYLAGSVHLLRESDSRLPAAFAQAYADSAALVMEIDINDIGSMDPMGLLGTGMSEDEDLSTVLGKARFEKVSKQFAELGVPVEVLERLQPWMAAMMLEQLQLLKLGFNPESGVEKQLAAHAAGDHKEITGLETIQDQLGMLANMSKPDQIKFLDLTLEEMQEAQTETDSLLKAWRNGDAHKLAGMLSEEYNAAPALYSRLVTDRNRNWIPQLERLLKADKNYMVIVGTLHIVGRNGLLDLLKADGFTSRQLQ